MNEWIDEYDDDCKIIASTIQIGTFELTIHHYVGCGNIWFVTSYHVFNRRQLAQLNIEFAKKKVIDLFNNVLKKALKDIEDIKHE